MKNNEEKLNNQEKLLIFLEIARSLNKAKIIPVLYGSLGLYRAINKFERKTNDIDILVPDEFIEERWSDLRYIMEQLGFMLQDEREHEFKREKKLVAFGKVSDLVKLAEINPQEIEVVQQDGVQFRELSPEQYLRCYKFMLRDNYRQEKRGNADQEKITLIEIFLKEGNNL